MLPGNFETHPKHTLRNRKRERERGRDDLRWDRWNSGHRLYLFILFMENGNPFASPKFNRQKNGWTTLLSFYSPVTVRVSFYSPVTVRGEVLNLQGVTSFSFLFHWCLFYFRVGVWRLGQQDALVKVKASTQLIGIYLPWASVWGLYAIRIPSYMWADEVQETYVHEDSGLNSSTDFFSKDELTMNSWII